MSLRHTETEEHDDKGANFGILGLPHVYQNQETGTSYLPAQVEEQEKFALVEAVRNILLAEFLLCLITFITLNTTAI
jgi:hypothetical protein